ncbi:MAG: McrC family protein, partial [Candidatus Hydrothermae bacterium]|nr:McrC family protein [Candidatus Hydrothermae bacterium]
MRVRGSPETSLIMEQRPRIVLFGEEYSCRFIQIAQEHRSVWLRWTGTDLQIIDTQNDAEGILQVLKEVSFRPCLDDAELPSRDEKDLGRLLGLCVAPRRNGLYVKAQGYVGITRIPFEGGELILQVKPRLENLDIFRMLVEVLSHPEVAPHVNVGQTYAICTDEPPLDLDVPTTDFLPFLLVHYLQVLEALLKRGLHRGYRKVRERLRGRVRGRLLTGATLRRWARWGSPYEIEVAFNTFTPDILENQILRVAFLKARAYLFHRRFVSEEIATWLGRIHRALEEVSNVRIFPYMFSHLQVVRIRKDYKKALDLARLILQNLGYDPTTLQAPAKLPVYPYWIDMPELFERYVEVMLRRREI